ERRRCAMAGLGIGLVAVAGFWNPKWALESLVLGIVYLAIVAGAARRSARDVLVALVPLIACALVALAIIRSVTSLSDYFFFTFRYNIIAGEWISRHPDPAAAAGVPFFRDCSAIFKGVWPVVVVAFVVAVMTIPWLRRRAAGTD